ncbi:hypothetical protein HZ326_23765 [Fusarium oxysporum f. sp. albedinis]|nr:hypothetical protein HZ326_23765 [Fusarium oxysporum f. sp. albedinis]
MMQEIAGHLTPRVLMLMSAHLPQFIAPSRTPELSVSLSSRTTGGRVQTQTQITPESLPNNALGVFPTSDCNHSTLLIWNGSNVGYRSAGRPCVTLTNHLLDSENKVHVYSPDVTFVTCSEYPIKVPLPNMLEPLSL